MACGDTLHWLRYDATDVDSAIILNSTNSDNDIRRTYINRYNLFTFHCSIRFIFFSFLHFKIGTLSAYHLTIVTKADMAILAPTDVVKAIVIEATKCR